MKKTYIILLLILVLNLPKVGYSQNKNTYERIFKNTMTPIELNHDETLKYTRKDGKILNLKLLSTSANILYTNKDKIPPGESGADRGNMFRARLMYEYTCDVEINGIPMTMRRYVCSQESFFDPYVINGVRIWLIGVTDIFEEYGGFLNTARSANGLPNKNARFVLQDMTQRICPSKIYPWFKDGKDRNENFIYKKNFIDIGRCFNGDDCFMGAYLAGESHGALDVDMAQNSLMYAPFDLDTQEGIRSNGSKTWPDGSEWRINTGHIIKKFVPDHTPVDGGKPYGLGARRGCWWHPHAHFGFQIKESGILYEIDPWIILWQLFEDNKKRDGTLKAKMKPLNHSKTGNKIKLQSLNNRQEEQNLEYYWSFGDGGWSDDASPKHIYAQPGMYPVTLTIGNGDTLDSFTQHISIEGSDITKPSISLSSPGEPSFRTRPLDALDVYGWPVKFIPNTLKFMARPSQPEPHTKKIYVNNLGNEKLDSVNYGIEYKNNRDLDWLKIKPKGKNKKQFLTIGVNGKGFSAGNYEAIVSVYSENALNSPQKFRVVMNIPENPPESESIIIDDKDPYPEFYSTPYFWVGHRFHGWGWPELKNAEGYNHFYLINGERDKKGEYARFTPDLKLGTYDVWLYERTPYASGPPANNEPARFQVNIVHAKGDTTVWMEPEKMQGFFPRPYKGQEEWNWLEPQISRKIGTFEFEEGNDGYVEILSEGSTGQVIVDAIRFLKMD